VKKVLKLLLIFTLLVGLCLSAFACIKVTVQDQTGDFDLLKNTIAFINEKYYADMDMDEADIYAAYGVMASLGNFNYIYPDSSLDDSSGQSDNGSFGLIVKFNMYNEVYIDIILEGSPFAVPSNGFQPQRGDEIYSIDGKRISGAGSSYFSSIVSTLTPDNDTEFVLIRDGVPHIVTYRKVAYRLVADEAGNEKLVKYTPPQCIYINDLNGLSPDFGYIYLRSFSNYPNNAAAEFRAAVADFKTDGNKALILDLRGNGGGNSEIFKSVASYLIGAPGGKQVDLLEVHYVKEDRSVVYSVTPNANYIDTPIYVLCDGGTASASEALIGSMKAHGTLTALIGKETVGKGVAQNGFTYYNGKEEGNIVDYVTDENGNVVADETYYLQVVVGQYYIFDESAEGGKYCMNGIPFKPDHEVEGITPVTYNYYEDAYFKIAADLYSAK